MTTNISPWYDGNTDFERSANLLKAIDQFHCPEEVKERARETLGFGKPVEIYVHPAQRQLDDLNKRFDDKE